MNRMEKELGDEIRRMKEMMYSEVSEQNRQRNRINPDEMFE